MGVLVDIHKPLYNAEFDIVQIYLMPEKSCCIKVPLYVYTTCTGISKV